MLHINDVQRGYPTAGPPNVAGPGETNPLSPLLTGLVYRPGFEKTTALFLRSWWPYSKLWSSTHALWSSALTSVFGIIYQKTRRVNVLAVCFRRLTWCSISMLPRVNVVTYWTWSSRLPTVNWTRSPSTMPASYTACPLPPTHQQLLVSCWALSTAPVVDGCRCLNTHLLITLSVQLCVQCDRWFAVMVSHGPSALVYANVLICQKYTCVIHPILQLQHPFYFILQQ